MKKYTLLEMVQKILSAMDADEVNSISDTVESLQVVELIEGVYNDIVTRLDAPEHYKLFEINASGDSDLPTVMYLPSTVDSLEWVKYNVIASGETDPEWRRIKYLDKETFIDRQLGLKLSDSGVFQYTIPSYIEMLGYNDRAPTYYTSFDDRMLVFDAYDSEVEATLQKSKTVAFGKILPTFIRNDAFTPDLDANGFSLLLNEAKALAFSEIKQVANDKAEKNARKGWIKSQRDKHNIKENRMRLPDYGRKK